LKIALELDERDVPSLEWLREGGREGYGICLLI